MAAGSLVFLQLAGWSGAVREPTAVLAGMAAGMVWGMVVSVSLVQALIRLSYGPPAARGGPRIRPCGHQLWRAPPAPIAGAYTLNHCESRLWPLQ